MLLSVVGLTKIPHLPGPRLVSFAFCIRNMDLANCRRQVSGGVPHEVSATDNWHPLIRSHHQPSRLHATKQGLNQMRLLSETTALLGLVTSLDYQATS